MQSPTIPIACRAGRAVYAHGLAHWLPPFGLLLGGILPGVLAPSGAIAAPLASTAASMVFDVNMFTAGRRQRADLSRFDKGNVVLPGVYRVDVIVNEQMQGRHDVTFKAIEEGGNAVACFDRAMLTQLGVDADKVARGDGQRSAGEVAAHRLPDGPLCGDLGQWIPAATASFDSSQQALSVSVPQIFMNLSARGYVDPAQWDNGINAGLLAYNFASSTATRGDGGTQSYLGLNGGINIGEWRLRHQGAQGWSSISGRQSYQNTATYLQRSIAGLRSQLIVGDSFSSGRILDSVRLRGISLASDDRMLPQSQQGYAPVVRGVAESNAKVSVSQNGYKIYETTVAPGPFVIDDLYPTGYGGDLSVTVTEASGRQNTYMVPYAVLPQLLRADTLKYSITAGQLRQYGVQGSTPFVMQATAERGISNGLTLYGGATVSQGYVQAKLGTAFSTPFGALSLDTTGSRTSIPGGATLSGQSYGVAFNKNIPETGTNFVLGAYRFSTSGYLNLPDAVNVRDLASRGQDSSQYGRQRNRLDVNLSQKFGASTLSLYGSSVDYWGNRQGRQTSYSLGYGSTWKQITWNLSLQRSRIQAAPLSPEQESQQQRERIFYGPAYSTGRIDNRIALTLTMPLGRDAHAPTLFSNLSRNSGDSRGSNVQVGVNGTAGEQRNFNYGFSAGRQDNNGSSDDSFNLYGGYQASAASLRAGYSQFGSGSQLSFSADGGLVAHSGGLSAAQALGDTVALVHAPDAEGALLTNASNVRVDRHGYAIVPYLTPFQNNVIGIDPNGMSEDVELTASTQTVAPTLGAVARLEYATVSGRAVVLKALQEDGKPLPFAAQVLDETGTAVGVVGQASKAFVRGIADSGVLTVKWGEGSDSQCRVSYALPALAKNKRQAMSDQIDGRCLSIDAAVRGRTGEQLPRTGGGNG